MFQVEFRYSSSPFFFKSQKFYINLNVGTNERTNNISLKTLILKTNLILIKFLFEIYLFEKQNTKRNCLEKQAPLILLCPF